MTLNNAGRPSGHAHGFKIPRFLDARLARRTAQDHSDPRIAAALEAIAMILEGTAPEEAAKIAGSRTGTIQIVLARIAAEGSIHAASRPEQSLRERDLRSVGSDADGLERVSALFADRVQGDRMRWLSAFYRGTPASLIAGAVGASDEHVLGWVERLQANGMAAFPDVDGCIHSVPPPPQPPPQTRPRREAVKPTPETEEQISARIAAEAEARARVDAARRRKADAEALLRRPSPTPDEVRAKMIGNRSYDDMAFLIATAMDGEQKHRLEALVFAARSADVALAGREYGYSEKTMHWHARIFAQKGAAGLLRGKAELRPFRARLNRDELSSVSWLARSGSVEMQAVLKLLDGAYPPEVARDMDIGLDRLENIVAAAGSVAVALIADLEDVETRDVGAELVHAGFVSGDFAALMSPHHSEDERLRAKALRLMVRGEPTDRVAAALDVERETLEGWAEIVLDEGTAGLLDERYEDNQQCRMSA